MMSGTNGGVARAARHARSRYRGYTANLTRLAAATVLLVIGTARAGAPVFAAERPFISAVTIYVSGGRVVADVKSGGLLSERIAGTIRSGLPAVVELLYSLSARNDGTIASGIRTYELHYDVWEDIYRIRSDDSTQTFGDFAGMGRAIEILRAVPIVPVKALDPAIEYVVQLSIAVEPLRGSEKKRIEGFVEETVSSRSQEAWHEQMLNVSDLISRFFSRGQAPSSRSDVYRTGPFTLLSLPGMNGMPAEDTNHKEP